MANEIKITFNGTVFVAECDFYNKHIPKQAGFWFHGKRSNCQDRNNPVARAKCQACESELGLNKWWTPFKEKAALLLEHCDDKAKAALKSHLEEVEASKAADANINVPKPDGLDYLPYQRGGIAYALKRKGTLIADEMGLGKTIEALGVINADNRIRNVLVICPASLRLNWLREAHKWMVRDFSYYIVDNPKPVPPSASFAIVNYDRLKGNVLKNLMERKWDCLICDEAHYLKNQKAKRTKKVLGIPPKKNKTTRKWDERVPGLIDTVEHRAMLLTGTPILNRPIELFPLINALDPRQWGKFFPFAKRYCAATQGRYGWDFSGSSNPEELQARLRTSVMVRRLKKDVLKELPAKRRQVVVIPPNGATKAVQAEQAAFQAREERLEELRAELALAHASGDEAAYKAAVEALQRGAQLAFEEMSAARKAVAIAKVPAVIEHIREMQAAGVEKIVVFAHHHEVLDKLKYEFQGESCGFDGRVSDPVRRQEAVDNFQEEDQYRLFIGGIKAAGVGITLTAASHVVFAELDWTPAWVSQCEDRTHRVGQSESVLIQHLVLDGSIDATMAEMMVLKQNVIDKSMDLTPELNIPVVPSKNKQTKPKKYPVPTDEERNAATEAIQTLAAHCDGARTEDGRGFNKFDTYMGKQLAARTLQRPMTDGEVFLSKKLARKYRRQLSPQLRLVLKCDEPTKKQQAKKAS